MYYGIHEFSKRLNKTPQTLRNWDKSGYLKPAYKSANGSMKKEFCRKLIDFYKSERTEQ